LSSLHSALRTILLEDPAKIEAIPHACASRLGALLEANRLEPLVYKRLKDAGTEESVSPERLASWKMAYVLSVGRALAYADALKEVLAAASARRLPVRLLRGTQLAFFVYPSPELRPLVDIEVQTPPESATELHFALRMRRFLELESLRDDGAQAPHRLSLLAREGVTVAIHRRSAQGLSAAPWDPFSDSARNLSRPRILRPEPLLVLLASDLAAARYSNALQTLCDLHVVVTILRPDWSEVERIAQEARLCLETTVALRLLGGLLGTPLDESVIQDLEGRSGIRGAHRELLLKLASTAITLYPASWRLSCFVERLLAEGRREPAAAARGAPPPWAFPSAV
jgi:hypothetical protein